MTEFDVFETWKWAKSSSCKLVNQKITFTCHDTPRNVLVIEVLNIIVS